MPDLDQRASGPSLRIEIRAGRSPAVCALHGTVEWASLDHLADALRVAFTLDARGRVLLDVSRAVGVSVAIRKAVHRTAGAIRPDGRAALVVGELGWAPGGRKAASEA